MRLLKSWKKKLACDTVLKIGRILILYKNQLKKKIVVVTKGQSNPKIVADFAW